MAVNPPATKKEYKQYYKQKEQPVSNYRIVKGFLIVILLAIAIVFVCMSGAFNISQIVVEGNVTISSEQVVSFSGIQKGTNLFALSKQEIMEKIKENPFVDSVQVKRCFPNKVKLILQERTVEYALPLASSYVYINRDGYILEISNQFNNVPILLGVSTDLSNVKENERLAESDLKKMNTVQKIMEMGIHHQMQELITKIDISNEEDYALHLEKEGKIAYLGSGTDLNTRFLYLKAILKDQQGKTGKVFVNVDLNSEYVYFAEEQL